MSPEKSSSSPSFLHPQTTIHPLQSFNADLIALSTISSPSNGRDGAPIVPGTMPMYKDPGRRRWIESALSDQDLLHRLQTSTWLYGRVWTIPEWLSNVPDAYGDPALIEGRRLGDLRDGAPSTNANEHRYARNKAVILDIHAELTANMNAERERKKRLDSEIPPPPQTPPPPPPLQSHPDFAPATTDGARVFQQPRTLIIDNRRAATDTTMNGARSNASNWPPLDVNATSPAPRAPQNSIARVPLSHRSTNGGDEASSADLEHADRKRKASLPLQDANPAVVPRVHGRSPTIEQLLQIADKIDQDISVAIPNEIIHLCGLAPIKIMATRPDEVLELAKAKLEAWKYSTVPPYWRRLYEDASLSKVMLMLRQQAEKLDSIHQGKQRELQDGSYVCSNALKQSHLTDSWMTELIKTLDLGSTISGAPGRRDTFEYVFEQLEKHIDIDLTEEIPPKFAIARPAQLITNEAIVRSETALSFADFQRHLDQSTTPLIIPGALQHWTAFQKWNNPNYFLDLTLGGRRIVPVEIGTNYTDADWEQKLTTFRDFMTTFVLSKHPEKVGYLAQHDLFAQIPKLRQDITVPDYCWTTTPNASDAAQRTAGYAAVRPLPEPLLNAWFGPVGTKSPLHSDPYHNILCQVVGYKYVRLYRPEETPNLYPGGTTENGVSVENTSQVDVSLFRTRTLGGDTDLGAKRAMGEKFPRFRDAEFIEGVLAPGECLYIPLGWWHYVESLSVSVSVSFWWN